MQTTDIAVLILEDQEEAGVLSRVNAALKGVTVEGGIKERAWTVTLSQSPATVRVEVRGTLDSVRAVLNPANQSEHDDRDSFDLILLDVGWDKAGGGTKEGLTQLQRFGWRHPTGPILALFTNHPTYSPDWLRDAMAAGAQALVWKQEPIHLLNLFYFVLQHKTWRTQRRRSQDEVLQVLGDPYWSKRLVARSEAMQATLRELVSIAAYDHLPVVLEGDIGTGKTLLAELVHAMSRRVSGPFISAYLNQCAPDLVAGELLGVAKGAATGVQPRNGLVASADAGTLFLDELQVLSVEHQEIIKNVIERKRYRRVGDTGPEVPCDVRFVLATNEPIESLVAAGRMKRDFARRIDIAKLRVPSLSERPEDVPLLAEAAIDRWCADLGRSTTRPKIAKDALEHLQSCTFPDNVAGLFNCVVRACMRSAGSAELLRGHFEAPTPGEPQHRLAPSDLMELARLGPRDKSSQRVIFDLLVSAAPMLLGDDDLMQHIQGGRGTLQTVISRINSRLSNTPYKIRRDQDERGYVLVKELAR